MFAVKQGEGPYYGLFSPSPRLFACHCVHIAKESFDVTKCQQTYIGNIY